MVSFLDAFLLFQGGTYMDDKILSNPFNYSGSKHRYLKPIFNRLPPSDRNYKTLDLFCGGGDFGLNLPDNHAVTLNDANRHLMGIYDLFSKFRPPYLVDMLCDLADSYDLTRTNAEGFTRLKHDFNVEVAKGQVDLFKMYLLIVSSFSCNIRWNEDGEWNLPFGQRNFNHNLQKKLVHFGVKLRQKKPETMSQCFQYIDFEKYDFLYADPPYLTTKASYQEIKELAWEEEQEHALYSKLLDYHKQGGLFMLSNQLYSKNKHNPILQDFCKSNGFFAVELDNSSYQTCNYQRKEGKTTELLITNYKPRRNTK